MDILAVLALYHRYRERRTVVALLTYLWLLHSDFVQPNPTNKLS